MATQWSEALAVGHSMIDEQHQTLVRMLGKLEGAVAANNKADIQNVFNELAAYTVTHFGMEERLMQRHAYPDKIPHIDAHADFIARVERSRAKLDTMGLTTGISMTNFLRDWLIEHIQKTDRKLAGYLKEKGVS